MRQRVAVAFVLLVAGCTALAPEPPDERVELPQIGAFSSAAPGAALPSGWRGWQVAGFKKPTEYRLVDHGGRDPRPASSIRSAWTCASTRSCTGTGWCRG